MAGTTVPSGAEAGAREVLPTKVRIWKSDLLQVCSVRLH
jgi:hypothetical protein